MSILRVAVLDRESKALSLSMLADLRFQRGSIQPGEAPGANKITTPALLFGALLFVFGTFYGPKGEWPKGYGLANDTLEER